MKIQKSRQWLGLVFQYSRYLCIIKAARDNLKQNEGERNNGANHDNKMSMVKYNCQIFIFEPAK